jgi:hypothetical protein
VWNPFSDAAQGAVTGLGTAIKEAVGAFKADPTKALELDAAVAQAVAKYEAETLAAINATMQAEAKSEHWIQWSWRPLFGYTACSILINNYILLPYMAKFGVVALPVPAEVWVMIMAVLGVAAYVRGRDK